MLKQLTSRTKHPHLTGNWKCEYIFGNKNLLQLSSITCILLSLVSTINFVCSVKTSNTIFDSKVYVYLITSETKQLLTYRSMDVQSTINVSIYI